MENGTLIVKTFVSNANLPLQKVAVYVADQNGGKIGIDFTDKNGKTGEFSVPAPNASLSQSPGNGEDVFATVSVYAYKDGYYFMTIENVQIFGGIQSKHKQKNSYYSSTVRRIYYRGGAIDGSSISDNTRLHNSSFGFT